MRVIAKIYKKGADGKYKKITLYTAGCIGNPKNCIYPNEVTVTSLDDFRKAVSHDHIFAKYIDSYRSASNFVSFDCVAMECDNDHSDKATDWVSPADVTATFADVPFYVSYSKSHNKVEPFKNILNDNLA